jgi:hypothetical protein
MAQVTFDAKIFNEWTRVAPVLEPVCLKRISTAILFGVKSRELNREPDQ